MNTGPPDISLKGLAHPDARLRRFAFCVSIVCAVWASAASTSDKASLEDMAYQKDRIAWMRSEQSPLALAGLFWLKAGKNTFGTDQGNDFILPSGSAPGRVGYFELKGNAVSVDLENRISVTLNGRSIDRRVELKRDASGKPDILALNYLRMKIIERGGRLAVRLIDLKSRLLLAFRRLEFYEINSGMRVEAKFLLYHPPKKIKVATVSGYEEELECPGIAQFSVGGTFVQLEPVLETPGDTKLFFMFKDSTNGKETYGGGRYLYSDLPSQGRVTLNFNQAHNPYCAYNSFSTCQIPPLQNWLKVPIRAGERKYPESK
jgi:uncharacterized protein (DUF1684 family)